MFRSPMRVAIALLSGALMCLAAPASAVAHGHAHAELLEHASADHGVASPNGAPSIGEEGHHEAHAHPTIDRTASSRSVQLLPEVLPGPVVHDFASHDDSVAAAAPGPFEPPPDPHDRAPANPRAPPVISAF